MLIEKIKKNKQNLFTDRSCLETNVFFENLKLRLDYNRKRYLLQENDIQIYFVFYAWSLLVPQTALSFLTTEEMKSLSV